MASVSVAGICFVLALVMTAMTGCFVYTPITTVPLAIMVLLSPSSRTTRSLVYDVVHKWNNWIQCAWFQLVNILLEVLFDARIRFTVLHDRTITLREFLKPPQQPGKFNILISNHRTRIDWMLLWMLLAWTDTLFTLKIVLKGELAAIPFFGWTMQTFRFLFLSRKWEQDQHHMEKVIAYMKKHNESATFLIFPEGSDLSQSNIDKSTAFAEKNGLPKFRYVLNPRTTGLIAMKNMIGMENIENIYDITMGFTDDPKGGRPNEASLINGRVARCVHYLCRKYSFSSGDIPFNDEQFQKWVEKRFEEKEVLLANFYSSSPPSFERRSIESVVGTSKHVISTGESAQEPLMQKRPIFKRLVSVVLRSPFWAGVTVCFWLIPSVFLWMWRLFGTLDVVLLVYITLASYLYVRIYKARGGIDKWLMY